MKNLLYLFICLLCIGCYSCSSMPDVEEDIPFCFNTHTTLFGDSTLVSYCDTVAVGIKDGRFFIKLKQKRQP